MGAEWQYKGEGNANIVFSYHGTEPHLQGCVLRVRKKYSHPAQQDESFIKLEERLWSCTIPWSDNPLVREAAYKARHIAPILGSQCVHIGQPVDLPDCVEKYLKYDRGIEFTLPAILLPDHTVLKCCLKRDQASISSGILLSDHAVLDRYAAKEETVDMSYPQLTQPWSESTRKQACDAASPSPATPAASLPCQRPSQPHCIPPAETFSPRYADVSSVDTASLLTGPSICVEIKPKCGFLSTSLAIKPVHSLKHFFPRYFMHQLFKFTKGKVKALSGYNPLDLFSGESERIEMAVMALLKCPQNNLRVFEDGAGLYGGNNGCSLQELEMHLQDLWLTGREREGINGSPWWRGSETGAVSERRVTGSDAERLIERQGSTAGVRERVSERGSEWQVEKVERLCAPEAQVQTAGMGERTAEHCVHGLEWGLGLNCTRIDSRHERKLGDWAVQQSVAEDPSPAAYQTVGSHQSVAADQSVAAHQSVAVDQSMAAHQNMAADQNVAADLNVATDQNVVAAQSAEPGTQAAMSHCTGHHTAALLATPLSYKPASTEAGAGTGAWGHGVDGSPVTHESQIVRGSFDLSCREVDGSPVAHQLRSVRGSFDSSCSGVDIGADGCLTGPCEDESACEMQCARKCESPHTEKRLCDGARHKVSFHDDSACEGIAVAPTTCSHACSFGPCSHAGLRESRHDSSCRQDASSAACSNCVAIAAQAGCQDGDSFTPAPRSLSHLSALSPTTKLTSASTPSRLASTCADLSHNTLMTRTDTGDVNEPVSAGDTSAGPPGQALLTRVICQVLQRTGITSRLLALQQLDAWDVEGIAVILERLLQANPTEVAAAAAESASLSVSQAWDAAPEESSPTDHQFCASFCSSVDTRLNFADMLPASAAPDGDTTCEAKFETIGPYDTMIAREVMTRARSGGKPSVQFDGFRASEEVAGIFPHGTALGETQVKHCIQGFSPTAHAVGSSKEEVVASFEHIECEHTPTGVLVAAHAVADDDEDDIVIFQQAAASERMEVEHSKSNTFLTAHAVSSEEEEVYPASGEDKESNAANGNCDNDPWPILLSEGSGDVDEVAVSQQLLSPRGKVLCQEDVLFCPLAPTAPVSSFQLAPAVLPRSRSSKLTAELCQALSGQRLTDWDQHEQVSCDGPIPVASHNVLVDGRSASAGRSRVGSATADDYDQSLTIGDDQFLAVANDRSLAVDNDQSLAVDNDQSLAVDNDQSLAVDNDQGLAVDNDQSLAVDNDQGLAVDNDQGLAVDNDQGLASVPNGSPAIAHTWAYDLPHPPQPVRTSTAQPIQIAARLDRRWSEPTDTTGQHGDVSPHAQQAFGEVAATTHCLRGRGMSLPPISLPCSAKAVMIGFPHVTGGSARCTLLKLSSSCPSSPCANLERVSRALLRKPSLVTHETAPQHAEALQAAIAAEPAACRLLAAAGGRLRRTARAAALRQQQHAAALRRIEQLPLAQCLADLRGYLIAATAKDCGIMVTVQRVHTQPAPDCPLSQASQPFAASLITSTTNTECTATGMPDETIPGEAGACASIPAVEAAAVMAAAGNVVGTEPTCTVQDPVTGLVFRCKVSFVDLDLKPLSKVLQHLDLDERIVEHTLQLLPYLTGPQQFVGDDYSRMDWI